MANNSYKGKARRKSVFSIFTEAMCVSKNKLAGFYLKPNRNKVSVR